MAVAHDVKGQQSQLLLPSGGRLVALDGLRGHNIQSRGCEMDVESDRLSTTSCAPDQAGASSGDSSWGERPVGSHPDLVQQSESTGCSSWCDDSMTLSSMEEKPSPLKRRRVNSCSADLPHPALVMSRGLLVTNSHSMKAAGLKRGKQRTINDHDLAALEISRLRFALRQEKNARQEAENEIEGFRQRFQELSADVDTKAAEIGQLQAEVLELTSSLTEVQNMMAQAGLDVVRERQEKEKLLKALIDTSLASCEAQKECLVQRQRREKAEQMLEIAEEEMVRMETEMEAERAEMKRIDSWREHRLQLKVQEAKELVESKVRLLDGLRKALTERLAAAAAAAAAAVASPAAATSGSSPAAALGMAAEEGVLVVASAAGSLVDAGPTRHSFEQEPTSTVPAEQAVCMDLREMAKSKGLVISSLLAKRKKADSVEKPCSLQAMPHGATMLGTIHAEEDKADPDNHGAGLQKPTDNGSILVLV